MVKIIQFHLFQKPSPNFQKKASMRLQEQHVPHKNRLVIILSNENYNIKIWIKKDLVQEAYISGFFFKFYSSLIVKFCLFKVILFCIKILDGTPSDSWSKYGELTFGANYLTLWTGANGSLSSMLKFFIILHLDFIKSLRQLWRSLRFV